MQFFPSDRLSDKLIGAKIIDGFKNEKQDVPGIKFKQFRALHA
jgi:hypothetical protein